MKVEEMALRSEIRQILNEAGFNRNTIKKLVKESIDDIVSNQVKQVLMEREQKDIDTVVSNYLDRQLYSQIRNSAEHVIREKLRFMRFNVDVHVNTESESENKT